MWSAMNKVNRDITVIIAIFLWFFFLISLKVCIVFIDMMRIRKIPIKHFKELIYFAFFLMFKFIPAVTSAVSQERIQFMVAEILRIFPLI